MKIGKKLVRDGAIFSQSICSDLCMIHKGVHLSMFITSDTKKHSITTCKMVIFGVPGRSDKDFSSLHAANSCLYFIYFGILVFVFLQNLSNKESGESRWRPGTQGRGSRGGRGNYSRPITNGNALL